MREGKGGKREGIKGNGSVQGGREGAGINTRGLTD